MVWFSRKKSVLNHILWSKAKIEVGEKKGGMKADSREMCEIDFSDVIFGMRYHGIIFA